MSSEGATPFTFDFPTHIEFGVGSIQKLSTLTAASQRPLVVTGRSANQKLGHLELCRQQLLGHGAELIVYPGLESNARYDQVISAAEIYVNTSRDSIIALGGGSVMDAARGIALAVSHEADLWDLRVTGPKGVSAIHQTGIPITTVPTVAGTGAEISPAALITRDHDKQVFFSPNLFPTRAIIDPALTVTSPPDVTARTGIDAFIQGLEAIVSPRATAFSDMFGFKALCLAYQWLPVAVADGADVTARTYVSLAAAMSLFAINQAGVGAIHALSTPLSGIYGLHHGEALSIAALPVLEANWESAPSRFTEVAISLGLESMPENGLRSRFLTCVQRLLEELHLPTSLRAVGVTTPDVDRLSIQSQNPDMATNPRALTVEEVRRLLELMI